MLALKPALMSSLKTPSLTAKTTTQCVSGVFFRPQKGARYLNPQTGLWLSTDPAMGEYVPQAPINDEAKRYNQNLPGMGGVFNVVNLHVYHYAGNNPVKYTDPDGRMDFPYFYIKEYFDNLIERGLSLPGIAIGNVVNSAKNFFSNIAKGEGSLSIQFAVRVAGSNLNMSLTFSGNGIEGKIDPTLISQLEAIAGTPVRTKYYRNNLCGIEFHVPISDLGKIGKISAILGGYFDVENGDATMAIGAKLAGPSKTSFTLKLALKATTIGDHPTVQGHDFENNFRDAASRDRFNEVWSDLF
jgi:hypothetical protein